MSLSTANSSQISSAPIASSFPTSTAPNASESQSLGLAFSSTLASTVSLPAQTSSNVPGPPGISKSSSLLFGFLVTFLALFVTFMACGFGGRRAMDIRRRRIAGGFDVTRNPSSMVKPQLWDVWVEDGGGERWPSMLPLSATAKRASKVKPEALPQPSTVPAAPQAVQEYFPTFVAVGGRGIARITATPTYTPAIRRGTSPHPPSPLSSIHAWPTSPLVAPDPPPSWLNFLSRNRKHAKDADKKADEDVEGLQVSVLIAMPTPGRSKAAEADIHEEAVGGEFGEFALGIAAVPWSLSLDDLN